MRLILACLLLSTAACDMGDIPLEAAMAEMSRPRDGALPPLPEPGSPGEIQCGDRTIDLHKIKFNPIDVTVCRGDTVTFINRDQVIHNVIEGVPEIRAHLFKSPKLKAGDSWALTTKEAGQWLIYCGTHKHKMRDFRLQVVERPE